MNEIDRVIGGLEEFKADFKPYCGNKADWKKVNDALDTLRAVKQKYAPSIGGANDFDGHISHWYKCGLCEFPIDKGDNYCRRCGRAVDWNAYS